MQITIEVTISGVNYEPPFKQVLDIEEGQVIHIDIPIELDEILMGGVPALKLPVVGEH